jgi:hypothetical protein
MSLRRKQHRLCVNPVSARLINLPACHACALWAAWKSRSRRPCFSLRHRLEHCGLIHARFRDEVHSRYAAVGEDHEDAYETSDCHGCGGCVDDAPCGLLLPSWLCRLRRARLCGARLRGRSCLRARLRTGLCARLRLFIGHYLGRRRLWELRLWRRLESSATTAAEIWRSGLRRPRLWRSGSSAPARLRWSAAGWPSLRRSRRPPAGLWASAATAQRICWASWSAWSTDRSTLGRTTAIRAGSRPG